MSTRNIDNLKSAVVRKNKRITELETALKKTETYLYTVASKARVLTDKPEGFAQTVQDVIIEARLLEV